MIRSVYRPVDPARLRSHRESLEMGILRSGRQLFRSLRVRFGMGQGYMMFQGRDLGSQNSTIVVANHCTFPLLAV